VRELANPFGVNRIPNPFITAYFRTFEAKPRRTPNSFAPTKIDVTLLLNLDFHPFKSEGGLI